MGQKNITSAYTEEIANIEGRMPERPKIKVMPENKQEIFRKLHDLSGDEYHEYLKRLK